MHMFWKCVDLGGFWKEVLDVICLVHHVQLSADPKTCILGILDDLDSESPVSLGISLCCFKPGNHWLFTRSDPPHLLGEYITRLNNVIRLEKEVYVKRQATQHFEAIWGPWLDAPGLLSQVLLQDHLFGILT